MTIIKEKYKQPIIINIGDGGVDICIEKYEYFKRLKR